jgi:hypothetical protein
MSLLRLLPAVLGGSFLLLGLAQAQTTREPAEPKEKPASREQRSAQGRAGAKPQHTWKLRLGWWNAPEELPELALQQGKDRIPFYPDVMSLSQVIEYHGDPNIVVVRKVVSAEIDKSGKPVVQWLPYCTIPVGEKDTDLGILLFPDEKRGIAQTRLFDFSPEAFPYGSVQLVNFTTAKIAVSIDGTTFTANSRGTARYPKVFEKTSACRFFMAAAEANGEQKLLRSTTMIFRETGRFLIFAIENPGASEDARYHTAVIIDNLVVRPAAAEESPAPAQKGKGKAAPETANAAR